MEKHIMEENRISYTLGEDGLYYPDLYLPEETEYPIGKYGMLRKTYLKEHRKGLYLELVLAGKLNEHLHLIDEECNPKSFSETLEISNLFPVMEICVSPEAFQYLNYCDNSREKELIAIIIDHICKLMGKIDKINYDLNALFPNPIQKKIFSLDYQEYHYFEPTENRENHFVHGEDEDILLNEIGEEILEVENWNIGIVDDEDRTKIVHEVVGILYKKLQQEVSVLSSRNLIEVLYDDLEKVLFKLMLSQKRYAEDIACYPEKEQEIFEQTNRDNKSSIALKFLIEYIAAVPPKKMFENTKKKKGYYTKHCRRVDWCNKHIDDFKKQYGLDDGDWRVIGVFILSQSLVSTEIYHKEIKMLTEKELSVSSIRNIY